jgi:hypothetical protein
MELLHADGQTDMMKLVTAFPQTLRKSLTTCIRPVLSTSCLRYHSHSKFPFDGTWTTNLERRHKMTKIKQKSIDQSINQLFSDGHTICVIKLRISLVVQLFHGTRPHLSLWAGLQATRGEIITNGKPNCLNYCEFFIVYTQFTKVAAWGLYPGRPRFGSLMLK